MSVDSNVLNPQEAPAVQRAAGSQNGPLLSINDLHVWYELRKFGFGHAGYVKAVDGVAFDLEYGESVAVVGESGCGKSTLMKTILGLVPVTSGEVIFEGARLSGKNPRELKWYRSQVGYVQQDPYGALPPFMSVRHILSEPMVINGIKDRDKQRERIQRAMEEVKMTPVEDFLAKFPHMLSGGQQQRVVIARAMILDPRLIVADEPVSMLDASVRVEILRLLRGLQASHNLAVIYITHDLSTVRYFSERIFVMYAGNLVEKSPVDELLRDPRHPYTLALLEATPDPDPENLLTFKKVPPGEPPSLIKPPPGCRFHPRCPHMIKDLCDAEVPPDFVISPRHSVACWLFK
jgi:peptide/nickel transport system ATP-binding protein